MGKFKKLFENYVIRQIPSMPTNPDELQKKLEKEYKYRKADNTKKENCWNCKASQWYNGRIICNANIPDVPKGKSIPESYICKFYKPGQQK